jgi:hypothetical protein
MHTILERGFGLVAVASILAACASHGEGSPEQTGQSKEALGEIGCTNLGVTVPVDGHYGVSATANASGCLLDKAIISNDSTYGWNECPNQFVYNLNHVSMTANNQVVVVPHDNIAQADCANTYVTLGIYARNDLQNTPWTLLGTATSQGVWNGYCQWAPPLTLPATSAYNSYMLAASAYTNVTYKGMVTPSYKLVYIHVKPC